MLIRDFWTKGSLLVFPNRTCPSKMEGKGTAILLYQQRSVLAFAGNKREPLSSAKQLGKINGNVHFKPCVIIFFATSIDFLDK